MPSGFHAFCHNGLCTPLGCASDGECAKPFGGTVVKMFCAAPTGGTGGTIYRSAITD